MSTLQYFTNTTSKRSISKGNSVHFLSSAIIFQLQFFPKCPKVLTLSPYFKIILPIPTSTFMAIIIIGCFHAKACNCFMNPSFTNTAISIITPWLHIILKARIRRMCEDSACVSAAVAGSARWKKEYALNTSYKFKKQQHLSLTQCISQINKTT